MTVLSDQHLRGLGRVTAAFAELEASVTGVISLLTGPDQTLGRFIVAQLSFGKLLDLLAALFRHRWGDGPELERLRQFLKTATEAESLRNRITHSSWFARVPAGGNPIRIKFGVSRKQGFQFQQEVVSAEELDAAADLIDSASGQLEDLAVSLIEQGKLSISTKE